MLDGVTSRLLLDTALQEEFVDLAHRQALSQVVKRAVLGAAMWWHWQLVFPQREKRSTREARRESGWMRSRESRRRLRWRKARVDLEVSCILAIFGGRLAKSPPASTNKKMGSKCEKCSKA